MHVPPLLSGCRDVFRLPVPAAVAIFLLVGFPALAIGGLVAAGWQWGERPGNPLADAYVRQVILFTLWQAALSTLLSVIPALALARAIVRRGVFAGRRWLMLLFALPLAMPQIVVVFGILAVWGGNGWLAVLLQWAGLDWRPGAHGLSGILLAHVFFNLPLATRLFVHALERLPAEYWRLAAQLGMPPAAVWRFVEWPALRAVLPGVALLVFLLCATSFTVVLVLGGSPARATLEVAIYQALRFDFDPPRALQLAGLQLAGLLVLQWLLRRFAALPPVTTGALADVVPHPHRERAGAWWSDFLLIAAAALFVALPVAGVVAQGLAARPWALLARAEAWQAIGTSLRIGISAMLLAVGLVLALLAALRGPRGEWRHVRAQWLELPASVALVMPPMLLAAGWFVLLHRLDMLSTGAPMVVAMLNALMSLSFVWRILVAPAAEAQLRHGRLCAALGIAGLSRWRLVEGRLLWRPLLLAAALALALSLGDFGAIALFGAEGFRTLPYLLYLKLGSYRTDEAAALALILLAMVAVLFALAEWLGREERVA